ncbi:Na+/H+ antiporter NhaC family protein [Ectobacillus ponti]|uniref:Sodium:proton antiporter n=1 Tax=Ectobacillus ponti TaxID=2961894 RepID=A0AA42BUD2_9BACI|nr:Na+/H+ antiporter NhaC family protein [Ectobacillus ponti]MCP8970423.1 sodium:proton antiporter [Ectobacillus ponti]
MQNHVSGSQRAVLLLITLAGILASVFLAIQLVIGFLPGFLYLVFLVKRTGQGLRDIWRTSKEGIGRAKIVILILFLVSFLLPSWKLSGTIAQMVQISLNILTPEHFLLSAFCIAMVVSLLLGTCVGTLSTVGIPIISSAAALHIPLELAAGALVSGAFVGDRTSPFSSAYQLLSNTLQLPAGKQWRALLPTTAAGVMAAMLYYGWADMGQVHVPLLPGHTAGKLSLLAFLPPALLLGAVLLRFSIVYAFLISILSAACIAFGNGISPMQLGRAFLFGTEGAGGLQHMYGLLLFLALAGAYNELLEKHRIVQPLLERWMRGSRSLFGSTWRTMMAALGISLLAANQTLPIILTGRSFLQQWEASYGKQRLAEVMANSAMLFPGMIPWSVLAVMCSTVLGVPLWQYVPHAIFLWLLPLLTVCAAMLRKSAENDRKNQQAC